MIRKSQLTEENKKLKRKLFIWEHIGVSINSSTRDKEIASEKFLKEHPDYNLYEVSDTIKINKGTLYHHLYTKVEKPWYVERIEDLTKEVIQIFEQSKRLYGAGKIVIALKKRGITTDKKTILKIMRDNNLIKATIIKKKKPTINSWRYNKFKDLVKRNFEPDAPNKIWVSDFLEIKIRGAKFYLCVILDLYARMVVAWRLSHNKNENLATNTFKDAFEKRNEPKDLIFHSDLGSEFTSNKFRDTLEILEVQQSFSKPGSPYDNACMEGFYSKLRSEEINVNIDKYENSMIMREYLNLYFAFYNSERIHTSNNGLTPKEKEDEWYRNHPQNQS